MSVSSRVWEHIRSGQPPDGQTVDSVTFAERGLLGEQGRQGLRSRMAAAVLGAGPLVRRWSLAGSRYLSHLPGLWWDGGVPEAVVSRCLPMVLVGLSHRVSHGGSQP